MESVDPLAAVLDVIRAQPHSAAALTLYALTSTMDYEQAGCLFKLNKLRDLDTTQRQLAYALMEYMVAGGNRGAYWSSTKQAMDALIRNT